MPTLDEILRALQSRRQRATYGAVGAVLDIPARSVLTGHLRDPLHSWVVRKKDGHPTGYREEEKHPDLLSRDHVISSGEELAAWLEDGERGS